MCLIQHHNVINVNDADLAKSDSFAKVVFYIFYFNFFKAFLCVKVIIKAIILKNVRKKHLKVQFK